MRLDRCNRFLVNFQMNRAAATAEGGCWSSASMARPYRSMITRRRRGSNATNHPGITSEFQLPDMPTV